MTQGLSRTLRDAFSLQSTDSQAFRISNGFALCVRAKDVFRVKTDLDLISKCVFVAVVGNARLGHG